MFVTIAMFVMLIIASVHKYFLIKGDDMMKLSKIRNNLRCFNCNEKMYSDIESHFRIISDSKIIHPFSLHHNKLSTCKTCNRDIKLNYIEKNWIQTLKVKFKYFILSDLLDKMIIVLAISLIIYFISFLFKLNGIFGIINNSILTIYWGLQIIQNFYILRIKKTGDDYEY